MEHPSAKRRPKRRDCYESRRRRRLEPPSSSGFDVVSIAIMMLLVTLLGRQQRGLAVHAFVVSHRHRLYGRSSLSALSAAATAAKSKTSSSSTAKIQKSTDQAAITASSSLSLPYRLVIVESPSKCKTIDKILNDYAQQHDLPFSYQVASCYGHVRDLSKRKIPIPPEDAAAFPYVIPGIDLAGHQYKPLYEIIENKQHVVQELRALAAKAQKVLLATDPDREGEAIAWHLQELLAESTTQESIHKAKVKQQQSQQEQLVTERVSFTEITPSAVLDAIVPTHADATDNSPPRSINPHLVAAQETRRILDRLVGFTLSPILWKKIAPGLSAGRVQSVGMALVVDRERERLEFESTEYWDLHAKLVVATYPPQQQQHTPKSAFQAKLVKVNSKKVAAEGKDFTSQGRQLVSPSKLHIRQEYAHELADKLSHGTWVIQEVQSKEVRQQPPTPYRTSTLQQDANRQLSLSVDQSMRVAQQLYEAGYISYMRTDSSSLSSQAEQAVEYSVKHVFGQSEYDSSVRGKETGRRKASKSTTTFAQEAHEAIRPALQSGDVFATPEQLTGLVNDVAIALYRMIYQRTLTSRMQPLVTLRTQAVIKVTNGKLTAEFKASGSVIVQRGYTAAYGTTNNDEENEDNQELPPLQAGQVMALKSLIPVDHETLPPPRYNEASFVKELETIGVGRPSTYASTVRVLRDRAYVGSPLKENNRVPSNRRETSGMSKVAQRAAGGDEFVGAAQGPMVPSLSALVVRDLLQKHCPIVGHSDLTAVMESQLDYIASGKKLSNYKLDYLDDFYAGAGGLISRLKRLDEKVDADDARRVSLPALTGSDSRTTTDRLSLYVGPWGPFVKVEVDAERSMNATTVSLPSSMAADISLISLEALQSLVSIKQEGGQILGQHPDDGRNIRLKTGRYGAFLQLGEDNENGTSTHSLPKGISSMRSFDSTDNEVDDCYDSRKSFAQKLGIDYEDAIGYVNLPRTISLMNDQPITAAIGPYGPYLKYNNSYTSLKASDGDVLTIDSATAEQLVTERIINGKLTGAVADLGEKDGGRVIVKKGRFGNYLKWKRVNAKLPAEYCEDPSRLPLDVAWALIKSASNGSKSKQQKKKAKGETSLELPPAPKRPKSAYLYFCADKRSDVARPDLSLGNVTKALATLWASTSDDDRKMYEAQASGGKAEYEKLKTLWTQECQIILDNSTSAAKAKAPKQVKIKKTSQVKRPKTAYLLFCAEKRSEVATQFSGLGAVTKELARLWAETSDRSKYEALARAEKEKYVTEKELQA